MDMRTGEDMTSPSQPVEGLTSAARGRALLGLNAFVSLFLAAMAFLLLNYLSYRHYARFDWSRDRFFSLSQKSREIVVSLTNDVDVLVFMQAGNEWGREVDSLLKEYAALSPYIRIERVDPDRDLARTEELARKYKTNRSNVVVFDQGGRSKQVRLEDLVELGGADVRPDGSPARVSFRGEQAFSSAIHDITQDRRPVAYFLQGHGERDPDNFDRKDGYSRIVRQISLDNVDVRKLLLSEDREIPEDCDVLVIAGPEKPLAPSELKRIEAYLSQQGRLMILLDALARSELEPLLANWSVRLVGDIVVDGSRTLSGRELFVTEYGEHPISSPLAGLTTVFYFPRSVVPLEAADEAAKTADKPLPQILASSSESGWAENNTEENPMRFDPLTDEPGPISFAVAVEKGPVPGFDVRIRATRLVVIGDSDFASNGGLVGANGDFFLNALNWLLEREVLLGIASKPAAEIRLVMNDRQLHALFWVVVAGLPALAAIAGAGVWIRRRA